MTKQNQDILNLVSDISRKNVTLNEQLSALHQQHVHLTEDTNFNLLLPDQVLTQLISLLNISLLEEAPVKKNSSSRNSLRPKRRQKFLSRDLVVPTMDSLTQFEKLVEATAKKADDSQLQAAHLAHEAAVQEDTCRTTLDELNLAQQRSQQRLAGFKSRATNIRSDMVFSGRLKRAMDTEAQDRMERSEKHQKREECQAVADKLSEDLTAMESSREETEAQINLASKAGKVLKNSRMICVNIKKQSQQQTKDAKKLVDHMQQISNKSKDTRQALNLVQDTTDTVQMQDARLEILQAAVELSKYLLHHELWAKGQASSTSKLLTEAYAQAETRLDERDTLAFISEKNILLLDDF
ncbi:MAG: hypothetical protein Q9181_008156 [Wetmoreana brouardii]